MIAEYLYSVCSLIVIFFFAEIQYFFVNDTKLFIRQTSAMGKQIYSFKFAFFSQMLLINELYRTLTLISFEFTLELFRNKGWKINGNVWLCIKGLKKKVLASYIQHEKYSFVYSGAFFLLCGITVTGVAILCVILPETRGLKLEDVQQVFVYKGLKDKD